ncbi:MAG: hypothetical protein R2711_07270 [Acidimicrobiales bacterium]
MRGYTAIDDRPFDPTLDPVVADDPDLTPVSWGVAISDDDDAEPRVIVTVEEIRPDGEGLAAHLLPDEAVGAPSAARRAQGGRRGSRCLSVASLARAGVR